ncbi:MAG: fibrobacter succinogenes major paralogous domain-containing protein [Bacteroidetes bacterium]|nr:fibrobacter succinogenes major paralogous domain-containing protein [Bacteroidota bacterium]
MFKKYDVLKSFLAVLFLLVILLPACKEEDEPVPVIETGKVTDIDGNEYKTVKIGNQWWMAENLKVSKYNNGTPIPFVQDPNFGWATVQDACCLYNNSSNSTGYLYNFEAVTNTSKLAPEGWHIPTDSEWKQLELHLGMSGSEVDFTGWRGSNEGEKLKMEANSGWAFYENVWATNESGFSAEAGSCIVFNGKLGNPGIQYNGFWWTSSEDSDTEAWYRHMDYKERRIFRFHGQNNYGFSIRCVKDAN